MLTPTPNEILDNLHDDDLNTLRKSGLKFTEIYEAIQRGGNHTHRNAALMVVIRKYGSNSIEVQKLTEELDNEMPVTIKYTYNGEAKTRKCYTHIEALELSQHLDNPTIIDDKGHEAELIRAKRD